MKLIVSMQLLANSRQISTPTSAIVINRAAEERQKPCRYY